MLARFARRIAGYNCAAPTLLGLALLSFVPAACQAPASPGSAATPAPAPTASAISTSALPAGTLRVGGAPRGIGMAAGFIYVANSGGNTISVIDARRESLLRTLSLPGGRPGPIEASHGGKHLFVLDGAAGVVHLFAPGRDHALVRSIPAGSGPEQLRISPDDHRAWVSLRGEAAVTEIDFAAGLDQPPAVRKIPVGKGVPDGLGQRALALGQRSLAVTNPGDGDLSLLPVDGSPGQRLGTGKAPGVLGFGSWDGQDQSLIMGNQASDSITLHHLASGVPLTLREVGMGATDIAVSADLTRAFLGMSGSNEVAVVDYRSQTLLKKIPVGRRPGRLYLVPAKLQIQHGTRDHGELWVSNDGSDSVTVIDAETLSVKATHSVGKGPHEITFWSHKAFVSNPEDGTISVIDRSRPLTR